MTLFFTIYVLVVHRRKDAYRDLGNLDSKLVAAASTAAAAASHRFEARIRLDTPGEQPAVH